jgi:hypothetical protein
LPRLRSRVRDSSPAPNLRESILAFPQSFQAVDSQYGEIAKWLCSGLQIRLSQFDSGSRLQIPARVVKLVDTTDLKSVAWVKPAYRFDSGSGHQKRVFRVFTEPLATMNKLRVSSGNENHQVSDKETNSGGQIWNARGMVMKNLISMLTFLIIAGCATGPVPYQEALPIPAENLLAGYHGFSQQKEGSVQVIVVRDKGTNFSGMAPIKLSINGVAVANFWPSDRLELFLMPDNYVFDLRPDPRLGDAILEKEVHIKSGKSYAFRIFSDSGGEFSLMQSAPLQ